MTALEKLIEAHVSGTVRLTVSQATQTMAEEMAREIIRDPAWKAEMQALVRKHFTRTLEELQGPVKAKGRKR